ncbi:MAG TPA: RMD1 family protein [Candidatus Binatia bacterium]|nr:RMD1 family protein [Candidatus Binatia bacterium]
MAFVENVSLRDWASLFPAGRRSTHELRSLLDGGEVFAYPFGAVVFRDVPPERREAELERLRRAYPVLSPPVTQEQFSVREDPTRKAGVVEGILLLDQLTADRIGVVAHTVAQSAALEYYERIVEDLFARTDELVDRLERRGTVSLRTRPLHRFIGAAVSARNEVLAVLHLLDKPDETWEDPAMNRIYGELRTEFDLADRFQALELKLRSVQEALELVLDVARDRRLLLLEIAVVLLFCMEIVTGFLR